MSLTRRIATAVASIWLSRAMAVAMGLVLMPIMFRHLEPSQLGLWLLLNQAGLMILLLDIGVTSTLTRRFAFARAARPSWPGGCSSARSISATPPARWP